MSANRRRGEIAATLDGRERRLCLTLGALAELEMAFLYEMNMAEGEAQPSGGRLGYGAEAQQSVIDRQIVVETHFREFQPQID